MNFEIMVNLGNEEMGHEHPKYDPTSYQLGCPFAGKRSLSNRVGGTELRGNHKREQESKPITFVPCR